MSATVSSGSVSVVGVTSYTYVGTVYTAVIVAAGNAAATTVNGGGALYVDYGGVTTGTVVTGFVGSDGVVSAGFDYVYGGVANGTVVTSNGAQYVLAGTASSTSIRSGGTQYISSGSGTAINDIVMSGASINDGGTLLFTQGSGTGSAFTATLSGRRQSGAVRAGHA